jgi:hypothetical protein
LIINYFILDGLSHNPELKKYFILEKDIYDTILTKKKIIEYLKLLIGVHFINTRNELVKIELNKKDILVRANNSESGFQSIFAKHNLI